LVEAFQELSVLNLDFSLDVTGCELPEIDLKIESLNAPEEEGCPGHIPHGGHQL
jgi:hypothetical protein